MKQAIMLGLAFTFIFGGLAACDSTSSSSPSESDDPSTNPPSTPGTPPAPTPPEDTDISVSVSPSASEGVAPLQVIFTATVSGTVSDSSWYINDREIQTNGPRLTFTFRNAGEYLVTYSVTNAQGQVVNDAVTVLVSAPAEPTPPGQPTPPGNPNPPVPDPPEDPNPPVGGDAPQITSFIADPPTITAAGQPVTLTWSVTGTTSLSIDKGVGAVAGTSTTVYPAATTTYTLTASNADGTDDETATVTLNTGEPSQNQKPTVTITGEKGRSTTVGTEENLAATAADPDGDTLAFKWTVTSGTAANVEFSDDAVKDTTAKFLATGEYQLTLTVSDGKGETATATVTFNVITSVGSGGA